MVSSLYVNFKSLSSAETVLQDLEYMMISVVEGKLAYLISNPFGTLAVLRLLHP
jgi:hypothetical protein